MRILLLISIITFNLYAVSSKCYSNYSNSYENYIEETGLYQNITTTNGCENNRLFTITKVEDILDEHLTTKKHEPIIEIREGSYCECPYKYYGE